MMVRVNDAISTASASAEIMSRGDVTARVSLRRAKHPHAERIIPLR